MIFHGYCNEGFGVIIRVIKEGFSAIADAVGHEFDESVLGVSWGFISAFPKWSTWLRSLKRLHFFSG